MKTNQQIQNQMELSFEAAALPLRRGSRRDRRLARAGWWFEQMHAVVDRALDWSATPPPRPEQTTFSLARAR